MASIAIIGAGCSGTLVSRALASRVSQRSISEVLLFDKTSTFGPGLPYGQDTNDEGFLLNMKSSLLGVDSCTAGDFAHWLKDSSSQIEGLMQEYAPRILMGQYLQEVVSDIARKFNHSGIQFARVNASVRNVRRTNAGFEVHTANGVRLVDYIVLAVGHLRKRSAFPDIEQYFSNPYHDLSRIKKIPAGSKVGVLGTKLTAVDMALLLRRIGVAHVHMFSNSGQLPLVRGLIPTSREDVVFEKCPGKSILDFFRWFRREKTYAPEYVGFITMRDVSVRLEHEIEAAAHVRDWQLWLDGSKGWIDDYWLRMSTKEKRRFYRKYQGLWMSYRHPMPLANALKIRSMLRAGELSVHAGYKSMRLKANEHFEVDVSDSLLELDYVIDATGASGNLAKLDSVLVENLIDSGMLSQYEFGGVAIDPETHQLFEQPGAYAIGPLTQGSLFYVSAMERLVIHAERVAEHIVKSQCPARSVHDPLYVGARS